METQTPAAPGNSLLSLNLEVFKEPRGFIRAIQFVLSIFAFATTTSHSTTTTFSANCGNGTKASRSFSYGYPFDLIEACFNLPVCGADVKNLTEFCLPRGSQSSAEFYVFVGVIVFLYCLTSLVFYIVFDTLYRRYSRIVVADFIISIVLTVLWVISSSAWAAGVSDIKTYTDPAEDGIFAPDSRVVDCQKPGSCKVDSLGNFASLNVSIIFGFLNFVVWVGNLWFLYKETPWFKLQSKPPMQAGAASEADPQRV
ncbi:hypothetical protein BsWGS_13683 [Bradybaena similaris]